MNIALQQALTEEELDRLGEFLEDIGPPALNLEMMDGYFAALISGPDMVLPSEFLSQIWGEEFSFTSDEEAGEIVNLVLRHWNTISRELRRTLTEPHVYMPVLLEDDAGMTNANDWANGFLRGIQARPHEWHELMDSEEHGGPLLIIMLLAHEHDPDPALRSPPMAGANREELVLNLIAGLTQIYRYFEPQRQSRRAAPLRRTASKVGRNEACPCGSGRKYKYCCIAGSPSVH